MLLRLLRKIIPAYIAIPGNRFFSPPLSLLDFPHFFTLVPNSNPRFTSKDSSRPAESILNHSTVQLLHTPAGLWSFSVLHSTSEISLTLPRFFTRDFRFPRLPAWNPAARTRLCTTTSSTRALKHTGKHFPSISAGSWGYPARDTGKQTGRKGTAGNEGKNQAGESKAGKIIRGIRGRKSGCGTGKL